MVQVVIWDHHGVRHWRYRLVYAMVRFHHGARRGQATSATSISSRHYRLYIRPIAAHRKTIHACRQIVGSTAAN
jgi:hypothetical protein